jgi:hypothetical protein
MYQGANLEWAMLCGSGMSANLIVSVTQRRDVQQVSLLLLLFCRCRCCCRCCCCWRIACPDLLLLVSSLNMHLRWRPIADIAYPPGAQALI